MQMHELHSDIEFKYVKVRKDGHVGQWERGHNRKFSLENPPAKDVFVDGGQYLIVSRHELLVETCNGTRSDVRPRVCRDARGTAHQGSTKRVHT